MLMLAELLFCTCGLVPGSVSMSYEVMYIEFLSHSCHTLLKGGRFLSLTTKDHVVSFVLAIGSGIDQRLVGKLEYLLSQKLSLFLFHAFNCYGTHPAILEILLLAVGKPQAFPT